MTRSRRWPNPAEPTAEPTSSRRNRVDNFLRDAGRVLCLGIGGGGDVVGALATAQLARSLGSQALAGGVTWERLPVDPLPGPRLLEELEGAEQLNEAVALAGPDTRGPGGFAFAESGVAGMLGERTVLVDPNPGAAAVAAGLEDAARRLDCGALALVDVGGDVLAHGHEPALGSPLCDAVMLAAGARLAEQLPVVAALFGPGCDGELSYTEIFERLAEVAAAGGLLGVRGMTAATAHLLEAATRVAPTEASAQALRCWRGELGEGFIRGGRRRVPLSRLGALTFYFEPRAAVASAARLARAVIDCESLEAANEALHALGVRTELDTERAATDA